MNRVKLRLIVDIEIKDGVTVSYSTYPIKEHLDLLVNAMTIEGVPNYKYRVEMWPGEPR